MGQASVIWAVVLGFFLTHQLEEVVYPIARWNEEHPRPTWRRWNSYLATTPMASPDRHVRIRTLATQTAGLAIVGLLVGQSLFATQIAATVLTVVIAVAFVMHIVASALTRSAMPGLTTSILPGLPGAALLLAWVWSR